MDFINKSNSKYFFLFISFNMFGVYCHPIETLVLRFTAPVQSVKVVFVKISYLCKVPQKTMKSSIRKRKEIHLKKNLVKASSIRYGFHTSKVRSLSLTRTMVYNMLLKNCESQRLKKLNIRHSTMTATNGLFYYSLYAYRVEICLNYKMYFHI